MSETKIGIHDLYKVFGPDPMTALKAVRHDGLSKPELLEKCGHVLGLENINVDAKGGEITVIMGLSGSGKSTLIRHVNRLIDPTVGKIIFEGRDILSCAPAELRRIRREQMSMVFQKFALLPHKTVAENAALALEVRGVDRDTYLRNAENWLDRVGLQGYGNSYPHQLSGGMQQRVGIARALTSNADVMLMDEAYSALDPLIRTDMQDLLLELQQELQKTILFITHDLDEALKLADHLVILKDGRVVQQDEPQKILLEPGDPYIVDFVSDINRARVLRVRTVMDKTVVTDGINIAGEIDQEENLETVIAMAEGDTRKTYLVKDGERKVGVLRMDMLVKSLVPAQSSDTKTRAR
ncbi:MAG: glycine/betaine ABC transporter [Alphaproteobacteria bacterium]|nr:glycine/betaine ABC transporter [Alphaproteobacteria bacterium]HCP01187.1 glycine/betaine ABC transporter [Rhodospirillaceae bacterium]